MVFFRVPRFSNNRLALYITLAIIGSFMIIHEVKLLNTIEYLKTQKCDKKSQLNVSKSDVKIEAVKNQPKIHHITEPIRRAEQIEAVENQPDTKHATKDSTNISSNSINIFDLTRSFELIDAYKNISCNEFTVLNVNATFCNYDFNTDRYSVFNKWYVGIREPTVFENFLQLLIANPDLLVFDFGVFVGQYTLFSAKLKHTVISVEAFFDNILRIHKGAVINNSSSYITLFHNGLSDKPNEIKRLEADPGHVARQNLVKFENVVYSSENATQVDQRYLVKTITMDDLVDYVPQNLNSSRPRAVMKIDIEGFEARAFQKAQKLFDAVDFCVVFMEWQNQARQVSIHNLIRDMIDFLYTRGFEPFDYDSDNKPSNKLNRSSWVKWSSPDIVWKKPGFLNFDPSQKIVLSTKSSF